MGIAYYRWFPGDYIRDTRRLTMLQHGAYRLLLDEYMTAGRPLPNDMPALYRICGASSGEEQMAVQYVVAEFFLLDGPVWRHRRCDAELRNYEERSESARQSAQARWRPTGDDANAMRTQCVGNANQSQSQSHKRERIREVVAEKPNESSQDGPTAPVDGVAADPPAGAKVPNCPAEEVIGLYHANLPELPRCKVLTDARQRAIRARWRAWAAMDGWESQSDGLDAFGAFFRGVAESPFLTGKVPGRDGRPPFTASLDWLMAPTNWLKVYEGAYAKKRGVTR